MHRRLEWCRRELCDRILVLAERVEGIQYRFRHGNQSLACLLAAE
jgi:hypothetical protein